MRRGDVCVWLGVDIVWRRCRGCLGAAVRDAGCVLACGGGCRGGCRSVWGGCAFFFCWREGWQSGDVRLRTRSVVSVWQRWRAAPSARMRCCLERHGRFVPRLSPGAAHPLLAQVTCDATAVKHPSWPSSRHAALQPATQPDLATESARDRACTTAHTSTAHTQQRQHDETTASHAPMRPAPNCIACN